MQKKINLQDLFLLRLRQERLPVTVFLMNGFQMRGTVTGYDPFVVVLESDGRQQVIYKHAISQWSPFVRWPCGKVRRKPPCNDTRRT